MQKPRLFYKRPALSFSGKRAERCFSPSRIIDGQSLIEYVVIFAIVTALSIAMIPKLSGIFSGYVATATGAMR